MWTFSHHALITVVLVSCAVAMRTTPMVIAHRGASATAPENTMPAFEQTFQQGADGFETDLRTSKDGYIVLIHDSTVDRTTNCTTLPIPGQCRCGLVNDLTLAELKTCDAGSWFSPEYAGTKIPTLDEAVALAKEYTGSIVMDLKTDDQSEGLLGASIEPILTSMEYSTYCIPSCWTIEQVENMKTYLTSSVKQKLGDVPATGSDSFFSGVIQAGAGGFSASFDSTTPQFVYEAHQRLMPVYVWTVNDATDMETAFFMGVDGILTDYPSTCVDVVDSLLSQCQAYRSR